MKEIDLERCRQAEAKEKRQKEMLFAAKITCLIIGVSLYFGVGLKHGLGNALIAVFISFALIYYPIKIGIEYF